MSLDKKWLTPARSSIENAKRELVYAIVALQRSGGEFDETISEIKKTIGDLEVSIHEFNDYGIVGNGE